MDWKILEDWVARWNVSMEFWCCKNSVWTWQPVAGFLMSLLLEMEIMHACPFDADDMGCVDPEGAAVAQSNPVVYNIQSAASVVASNKKKIQPPCKHSMLWHVVTMFQAPLVFIVASWGQLRLVAPGVLPFGLRTVLLHTRSILLSSRLDSFAVQLHFPHLLACFLKNLLLIHARCIPTVLDQVLRSGPVPL